MRSRVALFALVTALLVGVVACGGSAGDRGGADGGAPGSTTGGGGGGGAVTVTDATGAVTLPGPATRVVALEWVYAEDALALGVTPVGVADPTGYRDYVGAPPPLPEGVVDVGTRQTPSLERIRSLAPDLIIGAAFRHEAIRDQLEDIAPTLLFDAYRTDVTALEELTTTFEAVATALGRRAEAEAAVAAFEGRLARGAATLAALPPEQRRIVAVQGYVADEVPIVRVFTDESLAAQLFERLGLDNAWDRTGDQYGFTTTDLEGLTTVRDAAALYTASERQLERAGITTNPLWQAWAPVQQGRAYALGADAWTYGGLASAELLVDRTVTALAP